jgi:hypothetical protein
MAKIPKFKSLEEAAEFWDTHDFEDYRNDTEPVTIRVRLGRAKRMLTVPVPLTMYEQIEALAAKQGIRVEKLVAGWLKEKVAERSLAK